MWCVNVWTVACACMCSSVWRSENNFIVILQGSSIFIFVLGWLVLDFCLFCFRQGLSLSNTLPFRLRWLTFRHPRQSKYFTNWATSLTQIYCNLYIWIRFFWKNPLEIDNIISREAAKDLGKKDLHRGKNSVRTMAEFLSEVIEAKCTGIVKYSQARSVCPVEETF